MSEMLTTPVVYPKGERNCVKVCPNCGGIVTNSKYENGIITALPVKSIYCSAACRQAAYRKRLQNANS